MKTLISLIFLLISSSAFAGGSGSWPTPEPDDGGSKSKLSSTIPEIVFELKNNNEIVAFQRGLYIDNRWNIEELQIPANINIDPEILKALEISRKTGNWAPTNRK